ncbi:hypothetical protein [Polaribacter sp. Asnod1-A03]|uniref:hypothetical protein n=1 Tax=Polaribacter sp. Asnod1-A03 TaxID=3160581 RepID=UPI003865F264
MVKFKKEYHTLEYLIKTKTDSLYHVTTQKINKLSFNAKTELNQLEEKYGSSNLK